MSQCKHSYGFSAEWDLICLSMSEARAKTRQQTGHALGSTASLAVCSVMVDDALLTRVDSSPTLSRTLPVFLTPSPVFCGSSIDCAPSGTTSLQTAVCLLRSSMSWKHLPQPEQKCSCSVKWLLRCLLMSVPRVKIFLHTGHVFADPPLGGPSC